MSSPAARESVVGIELTSRTAGLSVRARDHHDRDGAFGDELAAAVASAHAITARTPTPIAM